MRLSARTRVKDEANAALDRQLRAAVPPLPRGLPGGPASAVDVLGLQRTVGNQATAALLAASSVAVQRFWVKQDGEYLWESDEKEKVNYAQTDETYWTLRHPWPSPVYVGLGESVSVSTEMLGGVEQKTREQLTQKVIDDIQLINRSSIGTRLLGKLAAARHRTKIEPTEHQPSSGPITGMTVTKQKASHDPFDPSKGAPATVNLKPEDVDVSSLPMEALGDGHEPAPAWNPTPSHVALFHELVHAYHFVNGTRVRGQLTPEQAVHPGDANVSLSEYQTTGINTRDGVGALAFAVNEPFTENAYRRELGLPHRDSYIPPGYKAPTPEEARLGVK